MTDGDRMFWRLMVLALCGFIVLMILLVVGDGITEENRINACATIESPQIRMECIRGDEES